MAKARSPRTAKAKTNKKVLQMPDAANGGVKNGYAPAELEPEIRLRAYELYEQRGCVAGQDEQDWFAAEHEVLARHSNQHTA